MRNEQGIYYFISSSKYTHDIHQSQTSVEFLSINMLFSFIAGEFEVNPSCNEWNREEIQELNVGVNQHDTNSLTSITSISSSQKLFADSEPRSGSEQDKPIADLHEEDEISARRSLEMTLPVAGLRTHGRHTEINHSGHETEFDMNNILRSHDSPMPESSQFRTPLSHNTFSCLATTNVNNSSNGHPFDPSQTSLNSPVLAASPDSDQFSVDGITTVRFSQEATTEENSQPAFNSPPSVRAFLNYSITQNALRMNPNNDLIRNLNIVSEFNDLLQSGETRNMGIEPVHFPSSSNSGLSSDYQSTVYSGESGEDSISSDSSVSTELGNDNFLHHPDIHSKD